LCVIFRIYCLLGFMGFWGALRDRACCVFSRDPNASCTIWWRRVGGLEGLGYTMKESLRLCTSVFNDLMSFHYGQSVRNWIDLPKLIPAFRRISSTHLKIKPIDRHMTFLSLLSKFKWAVARVNFPS
jgi:hypothetical protein